MDTSFWLVLCAMGVLLMRVGFAVYITGMVRAKNAAAALMRSLFDICLAVLAFWLVGGAILGAGSGRMLAWELLASFNAPAVAPFLFFALAVTLIPGSLVVGVSQERSRFFPMAGLSVLLGGIVVPLAWRWSRSTGWLGLLGYHDFAGAGMIHLVGAVAALAATLIIGPRGGKYNRDGSSNAIPGHNMPLASVGLLLVFVAWFPYILGFASAPTAGKLAAIGVNVMLAGASGLLAAVAVSQLRYFKPDIHLAYAGLLSGLVAISAGADVLPNWAAVVVGGLAGLIVPAASIALDLLWHIDDPGALVAVHGIGAVLSLVWAGLFTPAASFVVRLKLLGIQGLGIVVIAALALALSAGVLAILKATVGLRSREADEYDGLDLAEHDIGAYPDFQQTMIKSYHLREA